MERRQHILLAENEELKQLCLYLDEQRQALLTTRHADEHSEDLGMYYYSVSFSGILIEFCAGCGSSDRSTDSDHLKPEAEQAQGYNQEKVRKNLKKSMMILVIISICACRFRNMLGLPSTNLVKSK